ncbi:hypothetical protein KIN20_003405 [Parelaphostrongylus tenuis]|uniref:Uncharacterized protein n=1 Tax=Parelaphostrongylus tenuis TaxID=148309 RepID=A0AAD5QEB5_PARTN|nr:hypothetical protein KIN20_003405 [Parelaphostrongylus tenuis]
MAQRKASQMNRGDEKALIWNDYREDELKARLDKLQKLLDKIKEERLHQLRTKMLKWQEKYIRRLLELEIAMKDFERKSREDKAQIGEQISRIEEMSDINNAIRQRIEKRIAHLLPKMDPQENNFCFTAIIVNFVRVILYYAANIRDALWNHSSTKKQTPIEAKSSSSRTDSSCTSQSYSSTSSF